MKLLEDLIEKQRPLFEKGGKLEKLYPLFEANETFLLSPGAVTTKGPHVRDSLDMKRMMILVVGAILPCFLFGTYNAGYQSLVARGLPVDFLACILTGAWAVLPIVITSYAVGGFWEVAFALVRKHEINEGFLVTGLLFPLTLAPTTPLWMVAAGISFGVVIGKEIFGGTGMNILNPALTARAFVFFSYPAFISGDKVWHFIDHTKDQLVDGFSGATPLLTAASAKAAAAPAAIAATGFSWQDAFIGLIPGSIGETSVVAALLGAVILIVTGIGSWRIMASCVAGAVGMSWLMAAIAGPSSAGIMTLPASWHLVIGGFAFGTVFMATDPVSAAHTRKGQILYGLGIGALAILIRAVNPAYPEGMMLAILFMNVFAPLFDYYVVKGHNSSRARRRQARV
jgi:Na+-transporting NADH:ubiquinone oxidoreductase subunit B